ncbi:hypothetical protein DTO280E4_6 [Paecilomyces variotii]|nr:hypothetical protein DTO280E4_6 [Paecilomyces variotii]
MSRDIHKAERSPPSAQPGWTVRNLWNLDRRLTDVLSAIRDPIFLFKTRGLATCCDISVESEYNSCKARIYCSVDFKTEKNLPMADSGAFSPAQYRMYRIWSCRPWNAMRKI